MHELSIAQSILEAVRAEAAKHAVARVSRVGVRIGALSGVDPDSLSFCFEVLVKGSEMEPLALDIEWRKRVQQCPRCGTTFEVSAYELQCPSCGQFQTDCVGGDELELAYLELEDEPSTP
jgi:hydrogenase nickel incorporation protein HypA/HybF